MQIIRITTFVGTNKLMHDLLLTCVYPQMHVVSDPLIEPLRTVRTRVLLLVSVDLHVATQVAFVVEGFSTLRAPGCKFFCPLMNRPETHKINLQKISRCYNNVCKKHVFVSIAR